MKAPSRRSLLAGAAGLAASAPLRARAYPERSVTLVVPFAPGGSTDILARIVSDHLQRSLKQPVIVENRTGASGNIGTAAVARSAPDGYTLLFNTMSVHTMNYALFAAMPFDGVNDFSPITLLAYVTNTMVTHPSVPAANVAEFIAHAKANPGRLAYASAGAGSTNHLCGALLEKMAGISMVHVPYRGGAPAVARVLTWPPERQESAARMLSEMEEQDTSPYHLTDEQMQEVGLRRADFIEGRERYATEEEMAALWKKCGL